MSSKKIFILIAFMTIVFMAFGFQNSSEHKVLFEKAKFTMETKGDLKGAVKLFSEIIEKYPDEREYAAKSQLYIGLCYEKLGLKEAEKAFQKVVDNYPEQTETVYMAKEKLITLRRIHAFVEKGDKEFKVRQVWADPDSDIEVWGGAISPNGRYHAFIDWNTSGDLAILEIATGKIRRPTNKDSWDPSGRYAMYPRWSPDGKQIVYLWDEGSVSDLRVIGIDGSNSRILYKNEEWPWVQPYDWSPDGKNILATLSKKPREAPIRIILVSVADKSIHLLKTLNWTIPGEALGNMEFSPDGSYVAYARPSTKDSLKNDIFLLSVEEKLEIPLVEHPADDFLLGWSPNGKWLLFASDRTGTFDAWIIPFSEGKPLGPPELIKKGIGNIDPVGFTRKGDFYYGISKQMVDVYIFTMDSETGKITSQPNKATIPGEGRNSYPVYSPDGKYLAYTRASMRNRGPNSLCVFSLETGEEREFPLKIRALLPRWSPDGHNIFLTGRPTFRLYGIYKVDVQTGMLTPILMYKPQDKKNAWFMESSRDGKSFFYQHQDLEKSLCRIFVRSFEDGTEKELYRLSHLLGISWSLSPDGKWLAFVSRKKKRALIIIPATGGEPKELFRFEHIGGHPTALTWTADGKYILFSLSQKKEGLQKSLWRIPSVGGKPQNLGLRMAYYDNLSAHPDGEHIAFSSWGPTYQMPEIWVMENFLPKEKTKEK